MKATGIVRKIDDLGRVAVPKETRRIMGITEGDPIEFFTEGETIILKRYAPGCIFCGEVSDLIQYKEKNICLKCANGLRR